MILESGIVTVLGDVGGRVEISDSGLGDFPIEEDPDLEDMLVVLNFSRDDICWGGRGETGTLGRDD